MDIDQDIVEDLLSNSPQISPEPDQLKLIIVTCKTYLNCNINLELLAKKLVLDDQIIGKKLLGIIEEGQIKSKTKKAMKTSRRTTRKDFSNQCTIIVKPLTSDKKLNLKIFGNGKIVITGGLSKDEGKIVVNILKQKVKDLEDSYTIKPNSKFSDYFDSSSAYLKFIAKNYLVFLKIFSLYGINIDLRLDLILNKKFIEKYTNLDQDLDLDQCDPIQKGFLQYNDPLDIDKYLRMVQIFNIIHLYFPNQILLEKLDKPDNNLHTIMKNLYESKTEILPLTFDKDLFDKEINVSIENYNTMFNAGFQNNREIFTQILNDKYKSQGLISSAKFEPSNYQGINVKYISRVLCKSNCKSMGKKKNHHCLCKEVSFLIFQEGNVIITGGRFWEQLLDGYRVITDIMKNEYSSIVVEKNITSTDDDNPPYIIKTLPTGKKIVYLNKRMQINNNPRNVFLLKKLNLLNHYYLSNE